MSTIHELQDEMRKYFKKRQEACQKDVKQCFGILQAQFATIQNPYRLWDLTTITSIMMICLILHNIIIEDKNYLDLEDILLERVGVLVYRTFTFQDFQQGIMHIENPNVHFALQSNIMAHLWALKRANCYKKKVL